MNSLTNIKNVNYAQYQWNIAQLAIQGMSVYNAVQDTILKVMKQVVWLIAIPMIAKAL